MFSVWKYSMTTIGSSDTWPLNNLTDDLRVRPALSAVKFWAPNFFLETHSDYVKKLGSGEKPHLLAPQGTQGGYLGLK